MTPDAVLAAVRSFLADLDPRLAALAVVAAPLLWRLLRRLRLAPGFFFALSRGVARNPVAAVLLGLPLVVLDLLTLPVALLGSLRLRPAPDATRHLADAIEILGANLGQTGERLARLEASLGVAERPTDRVEVAVRKGAKPSA